MLRASLEIKKIRNHKKEVVWAARKGACCPRAAVLALVEGPGNLLLLRGGPGVRQVDQGHVTGNAMAFRRLH